MASSLLLGLNLDIPEKRIDPAHSRAYNSYSFHPSKAYRNLIKIQNPKMRIIIQRMLERRHLFQKDCNQISPFKSNFQYI